MASTKATVMEWAAAEGIDLVGGHPMCGKETSGIDHAEAGLFEHAPWVLTRDDGWITELIEAVGAHPVVMDAVTHDRLVAGVSHAAFLLSVGYVLALSRREDWPQASSTGRSTINRNSGATRRSWPGQRARRSQRSEVRDQQVGTADGEKRESAV